MSLMANNGLEKKLEIEEMVKLRELFDVIEYLKRNGYIENKKNPLVEQFKINNINFINKNIINIDSHPKNRFKLKLQKILVNKKH